jgi:hypothetical protein
MLINKEEINKYMQQEYEFVEKKIRALEKHFEKRLIIADLNEIAVSIEIPFATNQEGIDYVVDYVKNKIKPIFKKTILVINSAWFDERLLITITNDEPKN